jgi:inorganic pyrophosphatase
VSKLDRHLFSSFAVYKELEPDRVTAIEGRADRSAAERAVGQARARFDERHGAGSE